MITKISISQDKTKRDSIPFLSPTNLLTIPPSYTILFNSLWTYTMFAKTLKPFAEKPSQRGVVSSPPTKKLLRLPHVFSKILELPCSSSDDVFVEETPHFFRFVASCNAGGVRALAIEILPGITKIVIKRMDGSDVAVAGQRQYSSLGVGLWRFRLPPGTQPEMVTAVCSGGKLMVTVPKNKNRGN
ncbi:hypothetical protein VIGAN_08234000 [Vigna angularis var. angularis]|uniref:SHSP domain-containing protein n=2 Tax=Phaseolus angularis TaxID=3914 RepID=A0A0S3SRX1_PHAAN|nr:hypothetical protein VIGAN_08234000 [Vigna angularis var. angularis]